MSDTNKLIGAVLIGAAAGAVLGILFAPKSGKETRAQLSDLGSDLIDNLQSSVSSGKGIIEDLLSKVTGQAEQAQTDLKDEFAQKAY